MFVTLPCLFEYFPKFRVAQLADPVFSAGDDHVCRYPHFPCRNVF
jgi:hypothetical protein